jgi:hypothetical protein
VTFASAGSGAAAGSGRLLERYLEGFACLLIKVCNFGVRGIAIPADENNRSFDVIFRPLSCRMKPCPCNDKQHIESNPACYQECTVLDDPSHIASRTS